MTGKTHRAGAVLAGVCVALATGVPPLAAGVLVAGSVAAALVPDWDRVLDSGPDHRSITHSLILAGGLVVLAAMVAVGAFGFPDVHGGLGGGVRPAADGLLSKDTSPPAKPALPGTLAPLVGAFAVGAAAGYLSHLFLDSLTGKRIWLLLPGGPRFGLALFETGGLGEALLCLLILGATGLAFFWVLKG